MMLLVFCFSTHKDRVHVHVVHSLPLKYLAVAVGWIYFFAWAVSNYPQVLSLFCSNYPQVLSLCVIQISRFPSPGKGGDITFFIKETW